jgi:hypothetical protein
MSAEQTYIFLLNIGFGSAYFRADKKGWFLGHTVAYLSAMGVKLGL